MFTKNFSQIILFVAMVFLKFCLKICGSFTALAEKKKPGPEECGSAKNSFGSESGKLQIRQGRIRKTAPCVQDRSAAYSTRYLVYRDANPHHFNADPNSFPAFYFNADPDPDFHFNADLDTAPRQSDANLRPLVCRPSRAPFLNLQATIVSLQGSI
jgi:hypothetical protein